MNEIPTVPYLINEVDRIKKDIDGGREGRLANKEIIERMLKPFSGIEINIMDPMRYTMEITIKASVTRVLRITPAKRLEHFEVHFDSGAQENFRPAGWSLETIAKRIADDVLAATCIHNKKKTRNTKSSTPTPAPVNTK